MFDTISAIDNRLREKSVKKSIISAIYCRNIEYVVHALVNLIFQ